MPEFQKCSPEAIELIKLCLNKKRKERITIEEVCDHPWVKKYKVTEFYAPRKTLGSGSKSPTPMAKSPLLKFS